MTPYAHQTALLATAKRRFGPGEKHLIEVATGGGKTWILNEFARWNVGHQRRVLVVTKDWEILGRIVDDIRKRWERSHRFLVGYVGSTPQAHANFAGFHTNQCANIVFTTIQTWNRREWSRDRFDVILIDELHWGEGAPLYQQLLRRSRNAYVLGFTATPRRWSQFERIGRPQTFTQLVHRGVLARPLTEERATTTDWAPQRSGAHGDVTPTSLAELARNTERNRFIVRTWHDGSYGKTLVFGCNVKHAEKLSTLFNDSGVSAGYLHHKVHPRDRRDVLDQFRRGDIDVLVNVTMVTHGIDIPDIRSIFLARPTASDILFSQMIGRGARKAPGKDTFRIVDFVDNVQTFGVPLLRAHGFLGNSTPVHKKHEYSRVEFVDIPRREGYEDIAGLEVNIAQTFGIEFELATNNGGIPSTTDLDRRYASKILNALQAAGIRVPEGRSNREGADYSVWNVMLDSSCGLEVVSRVLSGPEGYFEVMDATRALRRVAGELDLKLSTETSTHVHLAWKDEGASCRNLLHLAGSYEKAIHSIVSPSRHQNIYCTPVKALDPDGWKLSNDHYNAVYFPLADECSPIPTVEVRYHNGTLNGPKILTWVSLWMRMMAKCQRARALDLGPEVPALTPDVFSPLATSDIAALSDYVDASRTLKARLLLRRKELTSRHWYKTISDSLEDRWDRALLEMIR